MNTKPYLTAILFFAVVSFTACSSTKQYIIYSVNSFTPLETVEPIDINVNVKMLVDNRGAIEENKVLFTTDSRVIEIDNKAFCINSERDYIFSKEAVASQFTKMMVKHFNRAKLFANATYDDDTGCNYYLTGALNMFYGMQEFSGAAVKLRQEL
jgi:hypothetical protein